MKRKILFSLAGAFLLLCLGFLAVREYLLSPYEGERPAWIYLPAGISSEAMADSLKNALGDRVGARTMTIYKAASKSGAPARGAYRVAPGTTAKEIARRLVRRRQTPVKLTFNNVRTIDQLAGRLAARMDFSSDQFLEAIDSLLPKAGFTRQEQYAAAFLPDTYEVYWTATAAETAGKLLAHRNSFWNAERRQKAAGLGLTPVQAATIASIAEEESNAAGERGKIARLYLNRINRGMKLQADPTVKFALGNFSLRRITGAHLKADSPYNTYLNSGLPPGPIRIAEARTIDALLDSKPHPYIYMCAKEDFSGTHNFAADFATHRANARRYQRALNERNIH